MVKKFVTVHCHFYQPPRENPWTGSIEIQRSASPWHDWNERINVECYRRNGVSRLLDASGWVKSLVNNYSKISFNFGPTLLSWLEEFDPNTYSKILEGDRLSIENFSGHGSAIAQAYNHMIMPLASAKDKETQVVWGLKDFQHRFRRDPESMWLPETAVDTETLEILAANGLKFVILAPRQAHSIRPLNGSQAWQSVNGELIDYRVPYLVRLPSGRSICAFFFNGALSRAVAFEGLLHHGEVFAGRLMDSFKSAPESALNSSVGQLVHIATDGETYGHHHPFGEMALSYSLQYIEQNNLAKITNYGEYLELFPPEMEVQIVECSSWSCDHGVERWRDNCGCHTGMHPGWNQSWRAPLREALDVVKSALDAHYESFCSTLGVDAQLLRNDYINVLLESHKLSENLSKFLDFHISRLDAPLLPREECEKNISVHMEVQLNSMLMFTSCGWFFDEVSGIETVQNLRYAFRALELARDRLGLDLLPTFLKWLDKIPSNLPEFPSAKVIFERAVLSVRLDAKRAVAHFIMSSFFQDLWNLRSWRCYTIEHHSHESHQLGKAKLILGRIAIEHMRLKHVGSQLSYVAFHLGDHMMSVGVGPFVDMAAHDSMREICLELFESAAFSKLLMTLNSRFFKDIYSVKDLLLDEQKLVVDGILRSSLGDFESAFEQQYEGYLPLMGFLVDINFPMPKALVGVAEFVLTRTLTKVLRSSKLTAAEVKKWVQLAHAQSVQLNSPHLSVLFQNALAKIFERLQSQPWPCERELLAEVSALVNLAQSLPFAVDLWAAQNALCEWGRQIFKKGSIHGLSLQEMDPHVCQFKALADALRVRWECVSECHAVSVSNHSSVA